MNRLGLLLILLLSLPLALHAQKDKIKIAAIGNSVTFGAGIENPAVNSYPAQLQKLLGANYEVGNFGRSGATLLRKGHNPYWKTPEFQNALSFGADIAIVHLGLNDTDPRNWPDYRDEFKADYSWLIDTLRARNPDIKIWIARLSPIFPAHPRFLSGTHDWFWQIQEEIPAIARANQVELVDFHSPLYNRPDLLPDALHPNREGAEILATMLFQRITGEYGGMRVADIFQDHMVLQRNQVLPVWGTANTGTAVDVELNGLKRSAKTGPDGQWKVEFPAMKAGGPYRLSLSSPDASIILNDIWIGDVWLASGQSNMYFPLGQSEGGQEESKKALRHPNIRLLKYKPQVETQDIAWDSSTLAKINQLDYFSGTWKENNQQSSLEFSAIAYHFGKTIHLEENVAVGLIEIAVGGSPLVSWIDRHRLESDPLLVNVFRDWRDSDFIQAWCRQRANRNLEKADSKLQRHPYEPAYNFESGIAKLGGFPIAGVLWYQGESDAHNAEFHEKAFEAFVESWRNNWGWEVPVYFVQLSSINRPSWPSFRDSQRRLAARMPAVYMAVSSDLGHPTDVHPTRKEAIGVRLAKLALKFSYGRRLEAEGPEARKAHRTKNRVLIEFDHGKGLRAHGGGAVRGFQLKTDRGLILDATPQVEGSNVILEVPEGLVVTEVLYGWKAYSDANLVNGAGLPASTFKINISD